MSEPPKKWKHYESCVSVSLLLCGIIATVAFPPLLGVYFALALFWCGYLSNRKNKD